MSRKHLFAGLALGIIVSAALSFFEPSPRSSAPAPRAEAARATPQGIGEGVKAPQTVPLRADLVAKTPPRCLSRWEALRRLDLTKVSRPKEKLSSLVPQLTDRAAFAELLLAIDVSGACDELDRAHFLKDADAKFVAACGQARQADPDPTSGKAGAALEICFLELMKYRFELVDYLTRDTEPGKLSDIGALSSQLFASLFDPRRIDHSRAAAIAERILELDPKNGEAALVAARERFLDAFMTKNGKLSPEESEALDRSIARMEALNPGAANGAEMRLSRAQIEGDVERMESLVAEAKEKLPGSDVAPYYAAWIAYLKGDVGTARATLEELAERDPSSARAKLSLENLDKGGPSAPERPVFFDNAGLLSATN